MSVRQHEAGRRRSAAVHHLTYLALGLGAGLALIVPAALWMTERPHSGHASPVLVQAPRAVVRADAVAVSDTADRARQVIAEQISRGRRLIAKPDIPAARAALDEAVRAGEAEALFLLAETFDPNRLAALGVTDVRAEAERARHLYREALGKGLEAARARLEQLR